MADLPIVSVDAGLLTTLNRSKSFTFKEGEVLQGVVVERNAVGGVTIAIKGVLLVARSDLELPQDTALFFRVAAEQNGKELRLQFLGPAEQKAAAPAVAASGEKELAGLMRAFSSAVGTNPEKLTAEAVEGFLKNLPAGVELPKAVKEELVELLRTSLKSSGQGVSQRLTDLSGQLPATLRDLPALAELRQGLHLSMATLSAASLKQALQDTGVGLEAKLKLLAQAVQPLLKGDPEPTVATGRVGTNQWGGPRGELQAGTLQQQFSIEADLARDLKGKLLQLGQVLRQEAQPGAKESLSRDPQPGQAAMQQIDGLLRDIGTLQLLSRATGSFYTFLPLAWEGLKEGEIALKKGRGRPGMPSCSCRIDLDLAQAGKLVITVLLHNQEFFVTFKAGNPDFKARLDSHLDELRDSCQQKGVPVKGVNILDLADTSADPLENLEAYDELLSVQA